MKAIVTITLALLLGVVVCAVGVVYAKHRTRTLFVQLQGLQVQRDALNLQQVQLQLEQSTWAAHARVQRMASERLEMRLPRADEMVIVRQ